MLISDGTLLRLFLALSAYGDCRDAQRQAKSSAALRE